MNSGLRHNRSRRRRPGERPARAIAAGVLVATGIAAATTSLDYPQTRREAVADTYHGVRVEDPYRWLEKPDAQATQDWVRAQNALAQPWLEALPQREWLKRRLGELWNYERFGIPRKAGNRYFYLRNDGRQNQAVLWVSESREAEGRVLFDPNAVRSDATVALSRFEPSPDGSVVAYGLSDGGTDWETWKFRRVADGRDLEDELRFVKFYRIAWAKDGSGVYYPRYPATPDGRGDDAGRPAIYFHRIGEPQSKDRLVYAVTDHPTRVPSAELTDDGRFLVISIGEDTKRSGLVVLDLTKPEAKPVPLFTAFDANYSFAGATRDALYVLTNAGAPNWRVLAIPTATLDPAAARAVVPETDMAIADETAHVIGGRLVVNYLRDARNVARVFEADGRLVGDVPVPGLGTLAGFSGAADDPETFFAFSDFLSPTRILRLDVPPNAVTPHRTPQIVARTDIYVTEQVFYPGKDGTRIPMFITRRRDAPRDGNQPVMLYGYGGFNISLTPAFRPSVLAWLEMGGLYVEANLRGGGEYGEAWHGAGTLERKQTVFDDFIAAAEFLVRERYTNPKRIVIHGRSNGGLLVGAVMLQRPELFGAALPAVGVLDMLRYHTASANARMWSGDYGLSEVPSQFRAQLAYSPVHNARAGACYPPTLVTTAERDDRVVPWHSFKFAAALQHAQACDNPILIRVETRAGHGAGKPVWMQIEDIADQWAFAAQALGMATP